MKTFETFTKEVSTTLMDEALSTEIKYGLRPSEPETEPPIKIKIKNGEYRGPTIYLDMDGVIANFIDGVNRAHKKKFGTDMDWTGKQGGNFNVKNAALIEAIKSNPRFWIDLKWMPNGKNLVNHVLKYKPGIISAYMKEDMRALKQKRKWLDEKIGLSKMSDINIVRRKEKPLYAQGRYSPNILIDDSEDNIKRWNAAGGIGILHDDRGWKKTIRKLVRLGFE